MAILKKGPQKALGRFPLPNRPPKPLREPPPEEKKPRLSPKEWKLVELLTDPYGPQRPLKEVLKEAGFGEKKFRKLKQNPDFVKALNQESARILRENFEFMVLRTYQDSLDPKTQASTRAAFRRISLEATARSAPASEKAEALKGLMEALSPLAGIKGKKVEFVASQQDGKTVIAARVNEEDPGPGRPAPEASITPPAPAPPPPPAIPEPPAVPVEEDPEEIQNPF